ncbi:MAG: nitronate monooxygenase [Bacteroidetes bacterium]|nr:nitronate monooxygenase [Bacteroidota bacterium]MCB9042338.1 nitronate monooxygenase [Chitinophagales bacterium]
MENRVCKLFGIKYPIIQAGMIWCSNWELAAAVSNAGGLGIIGAGAMYPEVLAQQLQQIQKATDKPFGVNVPLLYADIEKHIESIIRYKVPIVFTSAGNPKTYTAMLQKEGIKVVHVVSSSKFALKAEEAGVDAVVAEGFEAGGHNGREETTTLCLIPKVRQTVHIPLIAAGGIGSGKAMMATIALGAEGVQIGSRFVASVESSAHIAFKQAVVQAKEGDTMLSLKKVVPVRLLKNDFYTQIAEAENSGANAEKLQTILGRGRAKKGMYEGDMENGELEIGQVSCSIDEIKPAAEIVAEIWEEFMATAQHIREAWLP